MTVKMQRLQVIGLKSDLHPIIRRLHMLGVVQLADVDVSTGGLSPLSVDPHAVHTEEDIRLTLSQIRGMLDEMDAEGQVPLGPDTPVSLAEIQSTVASLRQQMESLLEQREMLRNEQDVLPDLIVTVRHLLPLMPHHAVGDDVAWIGLLVDTGHGHMLETIEELVAEQTDHQAEVVTGEVSESTAAMLIATPRDTISRVSDLLDEEDVSRLRLPSDLKNRAPDLAVASLRARLDHVPVELDEVAGELTRMSERWAPVLLLWRDVLADELDRWQALGKLAETERTFVIEGWVPARDLAELERRLSEAVDGRILITVSEADEEEDVPVLLDNPAPARPFEGLVSFLNMPRYDGIDPTVLMALFMPLLFGLILGDAGYGVVLLAVTLMVRSRMEAGMPRSLVTILAMGAGWAIVFGILFGEVFGTLGEQLGLPPILFHRDDPEHLIDLLLLTVGVGAAHVLLGLVIGVINGIREKDRNELMERGGQLVGLVALLTLAGVLADFLPQVLMTISVAGLIVGLVLLIMSLGWTGIAIAPIELIGLIGNVLSYLRIAAIGLASVYLAVVANQIAGTVGSLVVGIIVAVLLHALNIALGAFSPTIHSLRLHYVEFFGQFYHGGGRPYKPFKARAGAAVTLEP